MEWQNIAKLLDNNLSNQLSKFRTKNWVEINGESKNRIVLIVILDLKQQCQGLIYAIMLMHTYLLKEQ